MVHYEDIQAEVPTYKQVAEAFIQIRALRTVVTQAREALGLAAV